MKSALKGSLFKLRTEALLDMVHTDLAGPIDPMSHSWHSYALSFTDDYSIAVFVYLLRNKSDTVRGTESFIADVAPYDKIKCMITQARHCASRR